MKWARSQFQVFLYLFKSTARCVLGQVIRFCEMGLRLLFRSLKIGRNLYSGVF